MSNNQKNEMNVQGGWPWVLMRLLGILCILLAVSLALYGLGDILSPNISISYSILFVLPFSLGALIRLIRDPSGQGKTFHIFDAAWIVTVLALGGIILREGVICIVMLAPLWIPSAMLGVYATSFLQRKLRERNKLSVSLIALLPVLTGVISDAPQRAVQYEVSRNIVVNAPAEQIWPLLKDMAEIKEDEGAWNISQDMLNVPRPTAAVVSGDGPGAVRHASWQKDVSFEEHIFVWKENETMRWNFSFPNDSVQRHTDRHISPDGNHLKILEGGYDFRSLDADRTEVTLTTRYLVASPVNLYASLWGELLLGDIQTNVLAIIKSRAEGGVN
ncbi:MAG: hypothetical protein HWE25_16220 [Alphaproteobacteria bacterium]|nr:hypothetical protein [Alphaproteobacteria bacterium]